MRGASLRPARHPPPRPPRQSPRPASADPEGTGVADDRTEGASEHDQLELEPAVGGDGRGCAERRLAREDRDDRVQGNQQEDGEVGPSRRLLAEPLFDVPLVEELTEDDDADQEAATDGDERDGVALPERPARLMCRRLTRSSYWISLANSGETGRS